MSDLLQIHPQSSELLTQEYLFDDPPAVAQFLESYPFVKNLLVAAYPAVRKNFPQSPLHLTIVTDPEVNMGPELLLTIVPTTTPEEALTSFRQFSEDWWGRNFGQAQGKFSVYMEYRRSGSAYFYKQHGDLPTKCGASA